MPPEYTKLKKKANDEQHAIVGGWFINGYKISVGEWLTGGTNVGRDLVTKLHKFSFGPLSLFYNGH